MGWQWGGNEAVKRRPPRTADVFSVAPPISESRAKRTHGEGHCAGGGGAAKGEGLIALLDSGALTISPIIYEDFLPVSAAGIFQSNLGDEARTDSQAASNRSSFEAALGKRVTDEFALYEAMQAASYTAAMELLNKSAA